MDRRAAPALDRSRPAAARPERICGSGGRLLLGTTAALVLALACSDGAEEDPIARGARVYRANCIVCHNADPKLDGTVGPAIAGSSKELVEARVLRGEYPAGYTPKRDSRLMPPLPFLAPEIPFLAAFLESPPATARAR
jgi:mono/diheme cytochrome c family protein